MNLNLTLTFEFNLLLLGRIAVLRT